MNGANMSPTPPILFDFTEQFETERLLVRLPLPGDGLEVNKAIQESLQELRPWLIWANLEQSPSETEAIIRQGHIRFLERTELRFHGYLKETGELSFCGVLIVDWDLRKFEIGYWMRTKYTGHGLATEAVHGLEQLVIETFGANRIEIQCDSANVKSIQIAKRLGYSLEGILRSHQWNPTFNHLHDTMMFAKVRGIEF
jgi:ribosomal-protein-serine acetyltransferase